MTSNGVFSVGILILFYTCYSAPHETFAGALIHKKMFSLSLFILNIYCDQNYCIVQGLLFLNYFKCIVQLQYIFCILDSGDIANFLSFRNVGWHLLHDSLLPRSDSCALCRPGHRAPPLVHFRNGYLLGFRPVCCSF